MTEETSEFKDWPEEMAELLFVVHIADVTNFEEMLDQLTVALKDIPGVQFLWLNPNNQDYLDVRKLLDD